MKLSNFLQGHQSELQKRESYDGLFNLYSDLLKAGEYGRGATIGVDTIVNSWIKQQYAYREQLLEDLMTIARTVSEIASPILHIRNEVFRKGITWEPKFIKKCEECGKEYNTLVEECENEDCGKDSLRDPDEEQLETFKLFLDDCNIFDQDLESVLKEFHKDINTVDDGYLYLNKEYFSENKKDKDGNEIIRSKVVEIRRLRPSAVEFDLDDKGLPKNKHFLCPFHRDKGAKLEKETCDECGRTLQPAMYKYHYRGKYLYFLDSEICHQSKFEPSPTYGYSPIMTVFEKALTIIGMDRTLFRYFFEKKMSSSLLMVATDDIESMRRVRADIVAQLRQNPDYVPIVGYSQRQGGRGRVDFVRLFNSLQEMDYLPVRQEIRERIAGLWGLPPMWQSEFTGISGLGGQSQQLVMFSRVVESDQRLFNEKVFPFLAEAFNITDWELKCQQPEEKAEATRIQFSQQRASVAMMLKQMGFKVEVKEKSDTIDDINFRVSGEMEEQPQMGGMGGYGGEEQNPYNQQMGLSYKGWTNQLIAKGFSPDYVSDIQVLQNGSSSIKFVCKGEQYIAAFQPLGQLIDVWKSSPTVIKPMSKVSRKIPSEEKIFKPEKIEEDDS